MSLAPAVSGVLSALGLGPDEPVTKAVVPAVLRGHHAVLAVPPAPEFAAAGLAAALTAAAGAGGFALVLAPEANLEVWSALVARLAGAMGRTAGLVRGAGRASRLAGSPDTVALVTAPTTLADLLGRGAVPVERVRAVLLAWPELYPADDALVPLFNELAKDVPRVIATADPEATASLVERYAWRAAVAGPLAAAGTTVPRARIAEVSWEGRVAALGAIADLEDADRMTVWARSPDREPEIRAALATRGVEVAVIIGSAALPASESALIVCFDPPPPAVFAPLAARGAILLVPPGVERYAARWIARRQPVQLSAHLDGARSALADARRAVRERIAAGDELATAALSPLFEQYPATAVAAAAFGLWQDAQRDAARAAQPPRPAPSRERPARVWVNIGRKDGATLGEWATFLTAELGVPRESMGRLDLKETFSLIEFSGEAEAQRGVDRLAGRTFRGRRVAARIDRGRERKTP